MYLSISYSKLTAFVRMITQLQLTLDRNISKLSWTCVRRMSWTGKTGCACFVFYCDWLGYVALFHFRCLCQDGKTTEKAPFDILKTINCRPKKVIGFVSTIKCPTNCQPTLDEGQIILPTFFELPLLVQMQWEQQGQSGARIWMRERRLSYL